MAYTLEDEFKVEKESILIMELELQTQKIEKYTGKDGGTEINEVPVLRVKYNVVGGNDIKEVYLEQWYRETNKKYEFFESYWNQSDTDILQLIADVESWDRSYENQCEKDMEEDLNDYFNEK